MQPALFPIPHPLRTGNTNFKLGRVTHKSKGCHAQGREEVYLATVKPLADVAVPSMVSLFEVSLQNAKISK